MGAILKTPLIKEVRRAIDEILMDGEDAVTSQDLENFAASNFTTPEIDALVEQAATYVAARVRADFVPNLITQIQPVNFPNTKVLRILGSRVFSDGVMATRRSFAGHRKLVSRGIEVDATYPVYIAEDGEVRIFPDPLDGTALLDVVVVPTTVELLDDRLQTAVILYAAYKCLRKKRHPAFGKAKKRLSDELEDKLISKVRIRK